MATPHTLSARRFSGFRRGRTLDRSTIIEDTPQDTQATFDDLYDLSDDDSSEISVRFSTALSHSQATPNYHKRMSSLVIPSPTAWPTIQNYQKQSVDAPLMSQTVRSPGLLTPTPRMLSALAARPMDSTSSAPSLDGSLTSEELSSLSCPSTPDLERRNHDHEWSSPVQLQPQAMQILNTINASHHSEEPILFMAEMKEVSEQRPLLAVDVAITPVDSELSALSVPSPGGFFSTLEPSTRHTWFPTQEEGPATSIAERFYGVPWAQGAIEQVIEYQMEDSLTEGPPTARRIALASPQSVVTAQRVSSPQFESPEYKDNYVEELQAMGQSNFDRTSMWLQQQEACISDDSASIKSSSSGFSTRMQHISPIKEIAEEDEDLAPFPTPKSVRFADDVRSDPEQASEEIVVAKSDVFVEAAKDLSTSKHTEDAFVQRKVRTDKLRLDRLCLFPTHVNRLEGKYEVEQEEPKSRRPISDMFGPETTEESKAMATTLRQRRALDEIKPISWNLEATKMLNGGSLLTSPTGKLMPKIEHGRVLDLGGLTSCDWAWQVAIEHPSTTVTTVYTAHDQSVNAAIQGPVNHRSKLVPNLWTLPYADNTFHVISARNLMALLKAEKPSGRSRDEYDLVLRECMRILKPGGYLEFALLDADIVGGGNQSSATSVEFGFNLRTRGYDAAPTKLWLPRLRRAGFAQVRRAWLNLPLAQANEFEGTTADVSHISGLVGSWAWERWMVKLHKEMGREADRLLEGVPAALEEGSRTGASWRYLSGWARKPM
jgi:SAM-dependent methyltransferase